MQKTVYTTGEAAKICKVSQQTIIRCFDSGQLKGFRVPGSRFRRIPRDQLFLFMRDNGIPTDALESGRRKILVVDDDQDLVELITDVLERDGRFETRSVNNGFDAGMMVKDYRPDLIVLDVMLPDINGKEVCQRVRSDSTMDPVLLLTARDTVDDRVRGLDAGADDYVVKPFAFPELLARIRALLRRGRGDAEGDLSLGDLVMDVSRRTVSRAGRELDLTQREFELLEYLLRHRGRVVSREMLARDVWKTVVRYTPIDNVIDVHVARLRKKLDDPFPAPLLHTVRGVGFVLREETSA